MGVPGIEEKKKTTTCNKTVTKYMYLAFTMAGLLSKASHGNLMAAFQLVTNDKYWGQKLSNWPMSTQLASSRAGLRTHSLASEPLPVGHTADSADQIISAFTFNVSPSSFWPYLPFPSEAPGSLHLTQLTPQWQSSLSFVSRIMVVQEGMAG